MKVEDRGGIKSELWIEVRGELDAVLGPVDARGRAACRWAEELNRAVKKSPRGEVKAFPPDDCWLCNICHSIKLTIPMRSNEYKYFTIRDQYTLIF